MSDTPYKDYSRDEFDSDNDKPSDNSKSKAKKKYSVIPQPIREKFIKRVLSKEVTIKEAAKEFGLKFSTSKAILQTYKKEGRIGKKKNRERKTKVVNAVFIANFTTAPPSYMNSIGSMSFNDVKTLNPSGSLDAASSKSIEQALGKLSEASFSKGGATNGYNKVTQNIIKEFGNDFLRDFIEKNFGQNKLQQFGGLDRTTSGPNGQENNMSSMMNNQNLSNPKQFMNFGASSASKGNTSAFTSLSNLSSNSFLLPQKTSSFNSDVPQILGSGQPIIPTTNQNRFMNQGRDINLDINSKNGQKRSFQNLERESGFDIMPKNEQISDISVKRFKSGEDNIWDYDMDRSKKDLEDFIYKTHTAMKSNNAAEKAEFSDFNEYKDQPNS